MRYVGIDLHKRNVVVAVEDESGPVGRPVRIGCADEGGIVSFFEKQVPFEAVIEASASYRWLYDLLSPLGRVVLAHPLRLRAIVTSRAKTDKLDARVLAKLLRLGEVPLSYVPPHAYQALRDLTRARARLTEASTTAKCQLHVLLRGRNIHSPFRNVFCQRGRRWLAGLELGVVGGIQRDELLLRLEHYEAQLGRMNAHLAEMATAFPQVDALTDLYGIGVYSALLIVAEIGEVDRFRNDRQVGAYAGLTARVHQSGGRCYHGHITRQGSRWLRWILVQAAMKIVREDAKLRNFYTRVRKRSGRNVARVAVARKLAGICWLRLRRWHRERPAA